MDEPGPTINSGQPLPADVQSEGQKDERASGIRLRTVALVLIVQAALIWWTADSEIARGIYLVCYSLMMPTILYLLLVRIIRRWLPFNDRELLLTYIVLTATIPIIGFGGMRFLIPGMGYLPFFVHLQPQWAKYLPFLSKLPVLHNQDAIRNLFQGGMPVPWTAWIVPILFWSTYLILLSVVWIGMAAVLRRIWIHQERLTFPIAMIPLQLSDPKDDIFKRKLFWFGFIIPVVLQSLLVFHDWAPAVPALQLKAYDIKPMVFVDRPWNAIPSLPVGFYPMAVGLAYFVPSEVSFSCWFFWLVSKFSHVVGAAVMGDAAGTGAMRFPYRDEQAAGAWIGFALIIIWSARHHWKTVVKTIPADERRSVRNLMIAGLTCMVLCALMMSMAGIHPLFSAGIIAVYAAYTLTGARVRAEAGGQWTFAPLNFTPHRVTASFAGTQGVSQQAMIAGGYFDLIHLDIRGQSLPYLMEGLKTAEVVGIKWRTVLLWVAIGTITALALGWWSSLNKFYDLGAATAKVDQYAMRKVSIGLDNTDKLISNPVNWDRDGVFAMTFAAGFTMLLAFLRTRLMFFPFHPVGYVLGNSLIMNSFFVPFFFAWLTKTLVLRFGGAAMYRRSLALFVGIALGDVVIQAFWALIGMIFNVPIYQFLS